MWKDGSLQKHQREKFSSYQQSRRHELQTKMHPESTILRQAAILNSVVSLDGWTYVIARQKNRIKMQ